VLRDLALVNCEDGFLQKPDYFRNELLLSQLPQRLMIFPHYKLSNFHLLSEGGVMRG